MGVSMNWLAFKDADRPAILAELGLQEVGETSDPYFQTFACTTTPDGWLIITGSRNKLKLDRQLASTRHDGWVLACEMIETVMYSRARGYRAGQPVWDVIHNPDKTPDGVEVTGEVPAELAVVQAKDDRLYAENDGQDCDYHFDIPLDLSQALIGFRPDGGHRFDWMALRRQTASIPTTPAPPMVRREIVPILLAAGWIETTSDPVRFPNRRDYEFTRKINSLTGFLDLDFRWTEPLSGVPSMAITFRFGVVDDGVPGPRWLTVVSGESNVQPPRVNLWQGLTQWVGLVSRPAPPSSHDLVREARRHIAAIEAYLKTGERHPELEISHGVASTTWPDLPEGVPYVAGDSERA